MHVCICDGASEKNWRNIQLIYRFMQYKNANIANFVYYGKTRIKQ